MFVITQFNSLTYALLTYDTPFMAHFLIDMSCFTLADMVLESL